MRVLVGTRILSRRALRATGFRSRLLGLQFRSRWPCACDGILFPSCSSVHTFFTGLEPDLLFLDEQGRVLNLVERAPSWRVFLGPRGTREILELPSGAARRVKLRTGTRVLFRTAGPRKRE